MASERYREISFTRMLDNGEDPYEADMRVVFDENGRSYRRIISRMNPRVTADIAMEGDARLYEKKLMHEKRVMADYDDKNRPGRPILKVVSGKVEVRCGDCLGDGEAPDKQGNWKECKRCDGSGYVEE